MAFLTSSRLNFSASDLETENEGANNLCSLVVS